MATDEIKINYNRLLFLDIETSKVPTDNGEFVQVVYLANVLEVDTVSQEVVASKFFRTLTDTITYLNEISVCEKLICFAHNLDYELFHILREVEGNGILSSKLDIYEMPMGQSIFRDKNAPLSIWLMELPNINFRDSYALFNKSVKQLGKELDLPKLDYDYKLVRTPYDDLTQLDYDYNERDNVIVAKSLFRRWKQRGETLETTPLTFTASTKKDRHNFIMERYGKQELKALNIDNSNTYDNYEFYKIVVESYQGGLTTANKNYFNKAIRDLIMSIDITSSYPYQMCSRRFPIYDKRYVNHFIGEEADTFYSEILHGLSFEELPKFTPIKGYFATVEFEDIEIKNNDYLIPLSSSNTIIIEKEKLINGKVIKAKKLIMSLDNVTLSWINKCYSYEDIKVTELITTTRDRYLRKGEISFILHNFMIKQTMKGVSGQEINYALAKVNCNNMYGVKVQKPLKDRYDIINGEIKKTEYKDSYEYSITPEEVYNNFIDLKRKNHFKNLTGKNFDIFSDGVYVTAYARYMLVDMMIKLYEQGCISVYCDTDSLKFICKDSKSIHEFIKKINGGIILQNKKLYRFTEFKTDFKLSKNQYEEVCKLGTWDIESKDKNNVPTPYAYFKTMGAKKYAYIDYKGIHTTIAGCSKKVSETITKYCEINNLPLDNGLNELFSPGTMFDETCSGRTEAHRDNRPIEYINSLTYKNYPLLSNGGIIIEDSTYTLNLSKNDENMLDLFREEDIIRILNNEGVLKYV
jgi:hypothetical protein